MQVRLHTAGSWFLPRMAGTYSEPQAYDANMEISSAIPIHEEDLSNVSGKISEGRNETDQNEIPKLLMQLAEYYMAVKNVTSNPEIKVVLLDRQTLY